MEMKTLDDYLEEIDRWKEAASARKQNLNGQELEEHYRKTRMWLEAKIGRPLAEAVDKRTKESIPA